MSDLNLCVINGNVTRDPDMRVLPTGTSVTKLGIANNRSYKKGEEWCEETSFFNVVVFGKLAEFVNEKCLKGTPIQVFGRIKQDRWEKDGEKKSAVEIVAESVRVLAKFEKRATDGDGPAPTASEGPIPF